MRALNHLEGGLNMIGLCESYFNFNFNFKSLRRA